MKLNSRLVKSRHGVYYFRLQTGGIDKRWSLGTRDSKAASIAAYTIGAKLTGMKIDPTKIKSWTLKSDGNHFELNTEDNDADRAGGQIALETILEKMALISKQPSESKLLEILSPTMTLADAIVEYTPVLNARDLVSKSKRMALSTLKKLKVLLGNNFDMSELNDYIIEDIWLEDRLISVKRTTAKRDLSFIREFVEWAADRKRKYAPAKLTFSIFAEGEHYDYFSQEDLKNIFDHLQ